MPAMITLAAAETEGAAAAIPISACFEANSNWI